MAIRRSHEPDKASSRKLFRGLAQVIVQTGTLAGEIILTATAEGTCAGEAGIPALSRPLRGRLFRRQAGGCF